VAFLRISPDFLQISRGFDLGQGGAGAGRSTRDAPVRKVPRLDFGGSRELSGLIFGELWKMHMNMAHLPSGYLTYPWKIPYKWRFQWENHL
jgi:hypothetical protein